ncbi:hypothetical protein OKW40_003237 [Paraburkholderia sp. RAU6.4a]
MDVGLAALKKALLRARMNVYDPVTIALLSCLQNVQDVFGTWEWHDRLGSIAREFGLSAERLRSAGVTAARRGKIRRCKSKTAMWLLSKLTPPFGVCKKRA